MPRPAGRRFLTTVLFLDLVSSTATASRLGDARWREVLTRFRRVVRAELRRHDGREEDTTGDGFLATFAQPAQALEAAAAIAAGSQELGLDVRAGLHTGEVEKIEGGLGGVAVHIGARVMSLAGPAEILTTQTVKDLVVGSGADFEERGDHELKGVEGAWRIHAVRSVEGVPLPAPLSAEDAAARLEAAAAAPGGHRRRLVAAAGVAAVLAAAAIVAVVLVVRGGGTHAAVGKPAPPTLIRLDTTTGKVRTEVQGRVPGTNRTDNLWTVNGTLWQLASNGAVGFAVARDMSTGAIQKTIAMPHAAQAIALGFGSIWVLENEAVLSGPTAGTLKGALVRFDQGSGRKLATVPLAGSVQGGTVAIGNSAVWVLKPGGELLQIDPLSNRVRARYQTGAVETDFLSPLDGYAWICECVINKVLRFDTRANRGTTFEIPEQASLIGVDTAHGHTIWLLDTTGGTLTQMDPRTGKTEPPLALGGDPHEAVIAGGAVWAAAGHVVDRVDLESRVRTTIAVPAGFNATTVTADPESHSLWIGTAPVETGANGK